VTARTVILVDAENVLAGEAMRQDAKFEHLIADLREHFQPVDQLVVVTGSRSGVWRSRVAQLAERLMATTIVTRSNPDVVLAVEGMRLMPQLDHLVLVSGDSDLLALVQAAREQGKQVSVVAPAVATSAALAVTATSRLEPSQLTPSVAGLVAPGQGDDSTNAIVRLFQQAEKRIVVIDSYSSKETVRMMAFGNPGVDLILVVGKLTRDTEEEAAELVAAGGRMSLYRSKDVHDRWFAVDDKWFHSGGSLKDLGRRWTRLAKIENPTERADTEALLRHLTSASPQVRLSV
jgi:hypothetical protein